MSFQATGGALQPLPQKKCIQQEFISLQTSFGHLKQEIVWFGIPETLALIKVRQPALDKVWAFQPANLERILSITILELAGSFQKIILCMPR